MEVLRAVAATLRIPEIGNDPVTFSGPVTVKVTRDSDGSTVAEEAATHVAGEDEHWTVTLSGTDLEQLDILTLSWSDGSSTYTTTVEVVGGFVTSLSAIQDKLQKEGDDADAFTAREIALRAIEDACGVAFRPRYRKDTISGTGTGRLFLYSRMPRRILGVEIEGTALSAEEVEALTVDPIGLLIREQRWPEGRSNIVVTYEHGYSEYTSAKYPVRDLAAHYLSSNPTDWMDRATSYANDMASYTLVTPGVRGAQFPVPSVNAFVEQFASPLVG